MKPNTKSPYFILFLVSIVTFFLQAVILSQIAQKQIRQGNATALLIVVSIGFGLLLSGLAALSYFKTTRMKQTRLSQWLVFIITPILLLPFIAFFIVAMTLFSVYGLA